MKSITITLLLSICSSRFTPDQEQEHKQDFMGYDKNQDGFIDASEVRDHH